MIALTDGGGELPSIDALMRPTVPVS